MPRSLGPIPLGSPIVEQDGTITAFFRQRWQDVGAGWSDTPSVQQAHRPAQVAALGWATLLTVTTPGVYRVGWYLRKTRADGVSSSVTVWLTFVDLDGQSLTYTSVPLTADTVGAWASDGPRVRCGAPTDILLATEYASATPGQMRYDLEVQVEFLA